MGKRKESHATAGRNNSQRAQKAPPKLTASRHEARLVNASGAANSSTRAPHSPSAVATIATLRAMLLLPLVPFINSGGAIEGAVHFLRAKLWVTLS